MIAQESVLGRGKKGEHRLWRRVARSLLSLRGSPPDIAWLFCRSALYRDASRDYLKFTEPHMGLAGRSFEAGIFVEDICYL